MCRVSRNFRAFLATAGLLQLLFVSELAFAVKDPNFRWKMGYFLTDISAGAIITDTPRNSILTVQPSLLWDISSIRTKLGLHFTGELISDFGLFPVSGAGVSAYIYPFGISSTNETNSEGVLFQKSLTSPYLFLGLTPLNLNLNRANADDPTQRIFFNAFVLEFQAAIGLDYPLRDTFTIFVEAGVRSGTVQLDEGTIEYFNPGVMIGFMLTYF